MSLRTDTPLPPAFTRGVAKIFDFWRGEQKTDYIELPQSQNKFCDSPLLKAGAKLRLRRLKILEIACTWAQGVL